MQSIISFSLAFFVLVSEPFARSLQLAVPIADHCNGGDSIGTILFEIRHQGFDHVSYLFGTHHAFGRSFFDSLLNAKEKLLLSERLILEKLEDTDKVVDIINSRSEITRWRKYLSVARLEFIKDLFSNSKTEFVKLNPTEMHVFLSRYYKEKVCGAKSRTDSQGSMDAAIGEIADENAMHQIGLETAEEQLELIRKDVEGMPSRIHRKRLAEIIDKIANGKADDCMEIAWYRAMGFDYALQQPCRNVLMLQERNERWLEEIESQIRSGSCFIAVGLSHLMYTCGLVNQLRCRGYTVTAIPVR